MILDITPRIVAGPGGIAVFPGDTPASREVLLELARGDPVTLSTLRATVHLGAHADGESHYARAGRPIDRMPLDHYLGPCQVLDTRATRGARVRVQDLVLPHDQGRDGVRATRVLLRTGTQPDKSVFNADFSGLEPALVDWLADRGVITVGVDTPSVDAADSKDLPAHGAFARRGLAILEGLDLSGAAPGVYELIALPLPLAGFDASPVRAVLRPLGDGSAR